MALRRFDCLGLPRPVFSKSAAVWARSSDRRPLTPEIGFPDVAHYRESSRIRLSLHPWQQMPDKAPHRRRIWLGLRLVKDCVDHEVVHTFVVNFRNHLNMVETDILESLAKSCRDDIGDSCDGLFRQTKSPPL